ncbi:MAG: MBL fold metallo-hydrolase [Eubacterium sp.]|nr:MBL fold metallo-hydrolase [Eubacterium sp.]
MQYSHIQINTQSSIRIEGTRTVYFDPFQIRTVSQDADLICITHAHYDHFDPESIAKVCKNDTIYVAPVSMEKELQKLTGGENLHLVSPGEHIRIGDLAVKAQPAYNKLKPFHPKRNGWLGYLLEMDGVSYYIAGDTDAVKELQGIQCDVALVPIGGTYTMTAKEAAGLVNKMKPTAVIPIHYGSIVGKPEDADVFKKLVDPDINVIIKLK